uniref:spermatogenesis-associated protein 31-like n=1 Tax=Jaculus jaculus TaxID=51337 RepID=UPI001E1B6038|nr:spermatogenesis-associated protein 31-like [Jaculus jaculus]
MLRLVGRPADPRAAAARLLRCFGRDPGALPRLHARASLQAAPALRCSLAAEEQPQPGSSCACEDRRPHPPLLRGCAPAPGGPRHPPLEEAGANATCGDCPKKLKEKEKDGSCLEQMSPGYHFSSLENAFQSPSAEQDTTTLPPFCNMKEKTQQLMGTQELSDPKMLQGSQQKYDQLFWGLPSLHSESLVAAAWISHRASLLLSPFLMFNGISNVHPVPRQDKMVPLLSQAHALSYVESHSSSLTLSLPQIQCLPLNQVQAHLQSSSPATPSSSLPHIRDCETSFFQSQNKPKSFIFTENPSSQNPSLMKQQESESVFPSMVKRPQVYNAFTPNPSQEQVVSSILPDNLPLSPELQEKLEKHLQTWPIQHHWDLPHKIQEPLECKQLQEELTRICKAHNKPGPSQSTVYTNECRKDAQKVKFQLGKDSDKNLGQILGLARGLERSPVKAQGTTTGELERNLAKDLKSNSRNGSLRNIDGNEENILEAHLDTKSGQINQGLPPSSLRHSCLLFNDFSMSDTNKENRHLASSKSSENSVSTSQNLGFLNPYIQQALEAHIVKFWVRHWWCLPLKVLKPINVLKLKNTIMDESSSSSGSLTVFSPSCQDIERPLMWNPSVDGYSPSKAPPTREENRHPSATLTYNLMGRICQSRPVLETEREKQAASLLPRRSGAQCPRAPCLKAEVDSQFESLMEMKLADQSQLYAMDVLFPHCSIGLLHAANHLASRGLGQLAGEDRRNSLRQPESSVPKQQDSGTIQDKALAPLHEGDDSKRQKVGNQEERAKQLKNSKFTQVKGPESTFDNKYHKLPPKHKQRPLVNPFQNIMRCFLCWVLPTNAIKVQGEPPTKSKPPSATTQSQRGVRKKPHVDSSVTEAQKLMATVGEMLEKKMMLHHKLLASKASQHKEDPQAPVSQPRDHRPPSYLEQRRIPSHGATPSLTGIPPRKVTLEANSP